MPHSFEVLFLPFLACLVLTGIHVYLGIHVISRKVIFVDIALAQIAAFGATVAFLLGYDPKSWGAYGWSLTFAVVAAAVFALTRTRHERVPQEAVIGITYATASAAAILLADISPHGAEHLHDLLAGSIVWVTPHQIAYMVVMYGLIGTFHFLFRRQFLEISLRPETAYARGVNVRLWDFFFYLSFGVVITSSVQIAGVLLVFCYLVAPSVFAVMFFDDLKPRLLTGWGMATLVSAVGLYFSYDRPSGPTIIVGFAVALLAGGIAKALLPAARPVRALLTTAAMLVAVAGIAWAMQGRTTMTAAGPGESAPADDEHDHGPPEHPVGTSLDDLRRALRDTHPNVRARAVADLAATGDLRVLHDLTDALHDQDAGVREAAAVALGRSGNRTVVSSLKHHLSDDHEDSWVRLRLAQAVAGLGDSAGLPVLLDLAGGGEAALLRLEALNTLSRLAGRTDPPLDATDGEPFAARLRELKSWFGDGRGWRFNDRTGSYSR
ncbi:MAG TPA: iron chelate uptake ABC transporter family permease subunit [Candidatus Polarisedimenticolia bacterium]|nr:iron chelate uptake ABC transporter family permease subunit [Candidatus Polarisedimenticolia bacterium]